MARYDKLANDKEFIESLKNSRFFSLLFDRPEVILVTLCGSRVTGVTDWHSDYDITVLTTSVDCEKSVYRLKYQNHDVHWYYQNINDFVYIDQNNIATMNFLCPFLLGLLSEDYVIYKNPKYEAVINYIFSIKQKLLEIGGVGFYNKCANIVNPIIRDGEIEEKRYTKFIGHLVLISDILNDREVDEELVLAGKRIKYKQITNEQEQAIIEKFKSLKNYVENNPINVEELQKQIVRRINEIRGKNS